MSAGVNDINPMEMAGWTCEECEAREKTLNVHHKRYIKGHNPWEYDATDLQCLCEDCHEKVSGIKVRVDFVLSRMTNAEQEIALGVLSGMLVEGGSSDGVRYTINVTSSEIAIGLAQHLGTTEQDILDSLDADGRFDWWEWESKRHP